MRQLPDLRVLRIPLLWHASHHLILHRFNSHVGKRGRKAEMSKFFGVD